MEKLTYFDLDKELESLKDIRLSNFSSKIIHTKLKIYGIKTPIIKKLAKKYIDINLDNYEINKSYEHNFIYILINLIRLKSLRKQVDFLFNNCRLIDNWAIVDTSYKYLEILTYDDELIYIDRLLKSNDEFLIRYAYLMFFNYKKQVDKLDSILSRIKDSEYFYVFMAQAWLISELYIFHPKEIFDFLNSDKISIKLKRKAISKICDSYRVSLLAKQNLREILD